MVAFVVLAACQISAPAGKIGKGGADPDAFAGGKIEVTALDDGPAAKPAVKPEQRPVETEAEKPASPQANAPETAKPEQPQEKPAEKPATVEGAKAPEEAPEVPAALKTAGQIACEAKGGTWGGAGKSGAKTCILPTTDGGKTCRKQGDCDGLCLARSGTCSPIKPLFGCNEVLQADGQRVTLCID